MEIKDKIAIITGASSGIGLATAKLLSQNGAKVVLVGLNNEKLNNLAEELPDSLAIPADLTKEKQIRDMVKRAVDHYGGVDILINNAGRGYDAPLEKIDPKKFRYIFELDVVGPVIAMQAVIPIMRKRNGGSIINISSGTALRYLPNMSAYASLKRAIANISLTARQELKKDKISVSVIYPYITDTDFEKNTLRAEDMPVWQPEENDRELPPPDSAEYVAEKILEAIKSGEAEIFAHDWMKNLK